MRKLLSILVVIAGLWCNAEIDAWYYPTASNHVHKLEVVKHSAFTLGYAESLEQASWVIEHLTTNSFGDAERKDNFRADPSVSTGSASLADYKGSGYDRGHLAPAADFSCDAELMSESFYLSNMSPQVAALNRGAWAQLEDWVRERVTGEEELLVVTGPIITNAVVTRIGDNGVVVPDCYYKVLYDVTPPCKMIAFSYNNAKGESSDVATHVTTVDEVERLTGLDFFPAETNELEAVADFAAWTNTPQKVGFTLFVSSND